MKTTKTKKAGKIKLVRLTVKTKVRAGDTFTINNHSGQGN
jgi:hypothetical protein